MRSPRAARSQALVDVPFVGIQSHWVARCQSCQVGQLDMQQTESFDLERFDSRRCLSARWRGPNMRRSASVQLWFLATSWRVRTVHLIPMRSQCGCGHSRPNKLEKRPNGPEVVENTVLVAQDLRSKHRYLARRRLMWSATICRKLSPRLP